LGIGAELGRVCEIEERAMLTGAACRAAGCDSAGVRSDAAEAPDEAGPAAICVDAILLGTELANGPADGGFIAAAADCAAAARRSVACRIDAGGVVEMEELAWIPIVGVIGLAFAPVGSTNTCGVPAVPGVRRTGT